MTRGCCTREIPARGRRRGTVECRVGSPLDQRVERRQRAIAPGVLAVNLLQSEDVAIRSGMATSGGRAGRERAYNPDAGFPAIRGRAQPVQAGLWLDRPGCLIDISSRAQGCA